MHTKTVLLVEDSPDTRIIYGTMLEHHGYRVLEASNGRDGVRLAQEERPDVIVMNVSIPGLNGLDAARILKNDPATSNIPIIVCTAFIRAEGEPIAEENGCEVYLEKPCEPSRILDEVRRWIGPPPIAASTDAVT